jgi:hypothetical protein
MCADKWAAPGGKPGIITTCEIEIASTDHPSYRSVNPTDGKVVLDRAAYGQQSRSKPNRASIWSCLLDHVWYLEVGVLEAGHPVLGGYRTWDNVSREIRWDKRAVKGGKDGRDKTDLLSFYLKRQATSESKSLM